MSRSLQSQRTAIPFGRLKSATAQSTLAHIDALHSTTGNEPVRLAKTEQFLYSPPYYDVRSMALSLLFEQGGSDNLDEHHHPQLRRDIAVHIRDAATRLSVRLARAEEDCLNAELLADLTGFGPLEHVLSRDDITDIMVIGPKLVFCESGGKIWEAGVEFQDDAHLMAICQRIARRIGRRIDESSPMCDARLPDGSRVNIVVPPLAIDGTALTIRKFQKSRLNFASLVAMGALDEEAVRLLTCLVQIKCNIVVVGGTGSGKTTLLNSLNQILSQGERIVTCEDAAELQLQQRHIVRLETRAQNLEGAGEINMRSLVRNSLRMRPDRIVVGEIRGEEAFDFIQAMNTGHDGSMGTMHANSCMDALSRLEGLISLGAPSLPVRTIQGMITSALDILIEMRRFRDGSRRLSEISEIIGYRDDGIETRSILSFKEIGLRQADHIAGRYEYQAIQSSRIRRKAEHAGLMDALDTFASQSIGAAQDDE